MADTGPNQISGAVVFCVLCEDLDRADNDALHIFSTHEKREAFMDADNRHHIAYDYTLDAPERHEEPIRDQ